jgi:hypothetical protein
MSVIINYRAKKDGRVLVDNGLSIYQYISDMDLYRMDREIENSCVQDGSRDRELKVSK